MKLLMDYGLRTKLVKFNCRGELTNHVDIRVSFVESIEGQNLVC